MRKLKIGFIGNGCTGKTTAMFNLFSKMKIAKIHVGYVSDTARNVPFEPSKFDTKQEARLHCLFKQLAEETAQLCRDDVNVLLCERTVMDWFLYYFWTSQKTASRMDSEVFDLSLAWTDTYDKLFFMSDLNFEYVKDGYRPSSSSLRDDMSKIYERWLSDFKVRLGDKLTVVTGDIDQRVLVVEREGLRCAQTS